MTFDAQGLRVVHYAVDDQAGWLQCGGSAIEQIDHARRRLGDAHRFLQDALQQGTEACLGTEAGGNLEKTCQGLFHPLHGHGQLVHFQDGRTPRQRVVEVETADRIGLLNQ
ncbi:hypothetical protein D3C85_857950 [compost metagenome]